MSPLVPRQKTLSEAPQLIDGAEFSGPIPSDFALAHRPSLLEVVSSRFWLVFDQTAHVVGVRVLSVHAAGCEPSGPIPLPLMSVASSGAVSQLSEAPALVLYPAGHASPRAAQSLSHPTQQDQRGSQAASGA